MPELPEIETVKCGIQRLVGQTITNIVIRHYGLRYPINPMLPTQLINKKILTIKRRAKYLIFELSHGYLIIHLGMSGSLTLLEQQSQVVKKHDHVDIVATSDTLRYNDPRRFGLVMYVDNLEDCSLIRHLGPEPLGTEFTYKYLIQRLQGKKSTIKQLIMDNHIVVGVGNIYACEALFLAGISPLRNGHSLNVAEADKLVSTIKAVLTHAIELGGSSLRDYKQADGNLGYFQNVHKVYAKSGTACTICGTMIQEARLGQRNSFYCPNCQK